MRTTRFSYYFQGFLFIGSYWGIACFIFAVFRLSFLLRFGDFTELQAYWPDIFEAFWVGFRFDSKIIAIGLAPLILLQLPCLVSLVLCRFWQRIALYYGIILAILFCLFQISDQFYYTYFQNHIDIRAFGLIEDDTWATIASMWDEIPLLRLIFGLIAIAALTIWLLPKLAHKVKKFPSPIQHILWQILFVFIYISFVVLNIRGTLRTFPLGRDDLSISHNQFLNFLAGNGIFTFFDAWKLRNESRYTSDMNYVLSKYEMKNVEQAWEICCKKAGNRLQRKDISTALYRSRKSSAFAGALNSVQKPNYHVLFIIMESWSGYYFKLHTPQLNLLANLKEQMPNLIHFPNFFSSANGTAHSLENIFIANPDGSLIQTKYANIAFRSAFARPFQEQGYATYFITSGKLHWRNLNGFLPRQGFNTLIGKAFLESHYANAENNEWGVFDEYIYNYAFEVLSKAKQPVLLTTLSTTHHPPYQVPKNYKAAPLTIPPYLEKKLIKDKPIAKRALLAFQYANDALGKFIAKIRQSHLKDKTIIALTGDHNTWALLNYNQDELHWKYAVPFFLYLPPALKSELHINEQRFGSHKDILPTLHALAIPQAKIISIGNNLLSKKELEFYAKNNSGWAMNRHGSVKFFHGAEYYQWANRKKEKFERLEGSPSTPALKRLRRKAQAENTLLNYSIFHDINEAYPN